MTVYISALLVLSTLSVVHRFGCEGSAVAVGHTIIEYVRAERRQSSDSSAGVLRRRSHTYRGVFECDGRPVRAS
jgi:hypothetical protein